MSSVDLGSGTDGAVTAAEPVAEDNAPATMISGRAFDLAAVNTVPVEGFFNRMRRSPREYSNSSRLCAAMVFRSCSIWSMSGPAVDPPQLDFTPFLRFIFTSGFVKQTPKPASPEGCKTNPGKTQIVLELNEIPRGAGQNFVTPLLHRDVVFDSNSAYTGNIHTRFYRNHVSQRKLSFLALCQPRVLVNFQPQTMTRAMDEI